MELAHTVTPRELVMDEPIRVTQPILASVFREEADGLYRFVLARVRFDSDAAEELVQQTCFEATKHNRPPTEFDECRAWLRGVAHNLIKRHWRHKNNGRAAVGGNTTAARDLLAKLEAPRSEQDSLVTDESRHQLMLAVSTLNTEDQELTFAFYFRQQTQVQIAGQMSITTKAVETRLRRIRHRLRQILLEQDITEASS